MAGLASNSLEMRDSHRGLPAAKGSPRLPPVAISIACDIPDPAVAYDSWPAPHASPTVNAMSSQQLEGCVAVITGASLGIGRSTAIAMGRAGASVVVNYRSHEEEAQQVVDAVKYPPIGKRGLAGSRAASFGLAEGGIAAHVTSSNEETLITVQIETLEAVRNFDQIVSLDNIDCIFFGPSDLSSALGYHGQLKHPEVLSIIERLGKITIDSGKAAGTIARDLEDYKRWVDLGFQWVCTGTTAFLASGAKNYIEPLKNYKTSVR